MTTTTKPQQHSLEAALALLLAQVKPVNTLQTVDLAKDEGLTQALGRILAQDVQSTIDVPPADNSQMDGYVVHAADCCNMTGGQIRLKVTQRIPAGHPSTLPLHRGEAARIFTGGFMPQSASDTGGDALSVIMQEACILENSMTGDFVIISAHEAKKTKAGQWVRAQGSDCAAGALVLQKGMVLTPTALGLLASIGCTDIPVFARLKVGLMCTGDELVQPGLPLPLGKIYNSNRPMLQALLAKLGCDVQDIGDVADTLPATKAALGQLAQDCDVVISTGGVSVGEEDHVKAAVQALGSLNLWSLAIKPGKPFAFGEIQTTLQTASKHTPFMGLPGNPVSALVTFLLLVRPFILKMQGVSNERIQPPAYSIPAGFAWRTDKRREFLRVRLNAQGHAELFGNQNSGVLTSAVWGDGVVDVPVGANIVVGDNVRYMPFSALM